MWAATTYGDESWGSRPLGGLARISLTNLSPFASELGQSAWDRWLGSLSSVIGCWYLTILTLTQILILTPSWR